VSEIEKLLNPSDFEAFQKKIVEGRDPNRTAVAVCSGPGCLAYASGKVFDRFKVELLESGLAEEVTLAQTGCHGFCERGPSVVILPDEICYLRVSPDDVKEIIETTLRGGGIVERLLYKGEDGLPVQKESDIPFYKHQQKVVFGDNKRIDPRSIDDYIARGGYTALVKAITTMSPETVIAEVKESGLRGRGGGGFPAGAKWEATAKPPADTRYVIVNADEGDPGAYMDRGILEGNPHSVIEGLMIGGYAIGANEGYIYVRQEYPLAIDNVLYALEVLREIGLLGENILGTGFNFDIIVHKGAGAFVSGESSALMSAIEGRVGEPRPKYIRTSISGLRGKPSCLNNVETWANVPLIINKGADWFKSIGTEGSKGTKIFSLVGNVKNTGLVEVPMGMTLRQIIFDIGGGIRDDKEFKAVQTGGPSGGVIPEDMLDLHVDYDELYAAGSMMGSGGMIVMDKDTCMVNVAKYFLEFLSDESCGKCVPCRDGIDQLLEVLQRLTSGNALEEDLELIEDISLMMKECALCGLGQSAPNPVLSSIKYFKDEYIAHIAEKRCPGGVCKALIAYTIDKEKCIGCGKCMKVCPVAAITGEKKSPHKINNALCVKCDSCYQECPAKVQAVTKIRQADVITAFATSEEAANE